MEVRVLFDTVERATEAAFDSGLLYNVGVGVYIDQSRRTVAVSGDEEAVIRAVVEMLDIQPAEAGQELWNDYVAGGGWKR